MRETKLGRSVEPDRTMSQHKNKKKTTEEELGRDGGRDMKKTLGNGVTAEVRPILGAEKVEISQTGHKGSKPGRTRQGKFLRNIPQTVGEHFERGSSSKQNLLTNKYRQRIYAARCEGKTRERPGFFNWEEILKGHAAPPGPHRSNSQSDWSVRLDKNHQDVSIFGYKNPQPLGRNGKTQK